MTAEKSPTLALLAGGGSLPAMLAAAAEDCGWPVHILSFEGQPQPEIESRVASRACFNIASIGAILAHLKAHKVSHVVMGGHLNKPSLFRLKPDAKGLKLAARIRSFHDDALLRLIADFLKEEGFTVLPVTDLLPNLKAGVGVLGKLEPTAADQADIALGMQVLAATARLDIGQAVVVHKGVVLGVEAVEGTDALVARCALLRGELGRQERAGWLVKAAKKGQTDLADLPTVGPETIRLLASHNYKGVAVQAGRTLLIDKETMTREADKGQVAVVGVEGESA